MKLIFVSGLADIDKAALIDLAIQRSGRKSAFTLVDLGTISDISGAMKEAEDMSSARLALAKYYERIEKAMIARLKEQKGDLLVSGCLTFGTKFGYVRGVTEDFFRSFKPDIMVIFEKEGEGKDSIDSATAEQQRINRYFGTIYSSSAGSAIKIIKFREKKMIEAVSELSEVLKC
jgi:adenylate kinase